jgi:hypothetical protein
VKYLVKQAEDRDKEEEEQKTRPPPRAGKTGQTNRKNRDRGTKDEQPKSKRRATEKAERRAKPDLPTPAMAMFTVNKRTYFRDQNYENKDFYVRADQKEQYDQKARAQKVELSKTSKIATSSQIMTEDVKDTQLRAKIHKIICVRQAEEHVGFHLAAMYREKIHETCGIIARLWSEVDELSDDVKEEFLKAQNRDAECR